MKKSRLAILLILSLVIVAICAGDALAATMKTMKVGKEQVVVGRKPESSLAGWTILEKGGNAFDAIVAEAAANSVADASMNGLFGADVQANVYVAAEKKVYAIDGEGTAPKLATCAWYNDQGNGIPNSDGLLCGLVPGQLATWVLLLDKWGTMTLSEVLAPALKLMEEGFPTASFPSGSKLAKYPSSVATFDLNKDGSSKLKPYDLLKYPQYATTMRKVIAAEQTALKAGASRHDALMAARDRFYKGDIAQEMGTFSEKNGGLFRYEDFASYEAKVWDAVSIDYKGYKVYSNTNASQGLGALVWLNILKNFDLQALKYNSAAYLHVLQETGKLAFYDREWIADQLTTKVPVKGLLSAEYGAERAKLVDMTKASMEARYGNPWKYQGEAPPPNPWGVTAADAGSKTFSVASANVGDPNSPDKSELRGDTSGISCADKWGNVIVMTPSLHSGWGTGVVMGNTGVIFNCRGDFFSLDPLHPNAIAPGKRVRSTLMTIMVCDSQNRPVMTVQSPGADDQMTIDVQCVLNFIEWKMDIQNAIEGPRLDMNASVASVWPQTVYVDGCQYENRIPQDVQDQLIKLGHKVTQPAPAGYSQGSQGAMAFDYSHAGYTVYFGGADPRSTIDAIAK